MASTDMPNYKQKQGILHKKDAKPEELKNWGRKFLENGWIRDAIVFFQKAEDREGLLSIRRKMIEEGDVFLFRQTLLGLDEAASEDEWRQLGDRALALGKMQFAREAYRMMGDRKGIDKIDKLINPESQEEEPESSPGEETEET